MGVKKEELHVYSSLNFDAKEGELPSEPDRTGVRAGPRFGINSVLKREISVHQESSSGSPI
jgi:hypothetical protein